MALNYTCSKDKENACNRTQQYFTMVAMLFSHIGLEQKAQSSLLLLIITK